MISVIICCRTNRIDPALEANIEETIGVPHEIVCIDNSTNRYTIFQAYNEGIRRSRFAIICFMHDDIRYHTPGWGERVVDHFADPAVGMIGISGPRYISRIPGVWWGINSGNRPTGSTCQYNKDTDRNNPDHTSETDNRPIPGANSIEVLALDGLFFCIRRELFDRIRFDDKTYDGFHFYDIDISLQVHTAGFKLLCVYDILVEHISTPNLKTEWLDGARSFFDKWKHTLPLSRMALTARERRELETNNFKTMKGILDVCNRNALAYFSLAEKIRIIRYCYPFILKKLLRLK